MSSLPTSTPARSASTSRRSSCSGERALGSMGGSRPHPHPHRLKSSGGGRSQRMIWTCRQGTNA
eukprot:2035169-Alexandrium_andersonii.AAC.1